MNIGSLTSEITKALKSYTKEVEEELEKAKEDISKDAVRKLKATSPKRTGNYARGWRRKKQGKGYVIHNSTSYQLTHLLENGHVLRNGGRSKKYIHIKPVEEDSIKVFIERVERVIKG